MHTHLFSFQFLLFCSVFLDTASTTLFITHNSPLKPKNVNTQTFSSHSTFLAFRWMSNATVSPDGALSPSESLALGIAIPGLVIIAGGIVLYLGWRQHREDAQVSLEGNDAGDIQHGSIRYTPPLLPPPHPELRPAGTLHVPMMAMDQEQYHGSQQRSQPEQKEDEGVILSRADSSVWFRADSIASLTDPNQAVCLICLERRPHVAMVPCGHVTMCRQCVHEMGAKRIPKSCMMCRKEVVVALPLLLPASKDGKETCKVCFLNNACVAVRPCGHVSMCEPCSFRLGKWSCPVCRNRHTGVQHVFW